MPSTFRGAIYVPKGLGTSYEAGFLGHSHLYKPTILPLALVVLPQLWKGHRFVLAPWKQVAILTLLPVPPSPPIISAATPSSF